MNGMTVTEMKRKVYIILKDDADNQQLKELKEKLKEEKVKDK